MNHNLMIYLISINPSIKEIMDTMNCKVKSLNPKTGLVYVEPSHLQLQEIANLATKNMEALRKPRTITDKENLGLVFKATTYNFGIFTSQLQSYVWIRTKLIADLITSAQLNLDNDLLLPALISYRSAIEQIANFSATQSRMLHFRDQRKNLHIPNFDLIADVRSTVVPMLFGTRVNWGNFFEIPLNSGKTKGYKPAENTIDLTAELLMKNVDSFDKSVKGIRKSYDFLSEFAHPNIGGYFIYRSNKSTVMKPSPFKFAETVISSDTPSFSLKELSPVIHQLLSIINSALSKFEEETKEYENIQKIINKDIKLIIKVNILRTSEFWNSREPCPCLSGKEISKCCGKKIDYKH